MAEPTGVLSFQDMILRVAEKAGMAYYGSDGQGKPVVPVDAFNLDKCRRIVNDGFRLFDGSPPENGWHWKERIAAVLLQATESGTATGGTSTTLIDTVNRDEANDYFNDWLITITAGTGVGEYALVTDFVSGTSTVTFSGGLSGSSTPDTTSIYQIEKVNLMPEDFDGQIDGKITYSSSSNHASKINIVDESIIRSLRADFVSTGYVDRVAFVPYTPAAGSLGTRRWEMLVYPAPSVSDTLKIPYTSHFNTMDCETGVATGGSALTLLDTGREEASGYFDAWILTITAGTGLGQTATITTYVTGGTFNFTALSGGATPDTTSVYYVEPAANLHPAGFRFDLQIQAACYAEAEKQIEEINEGAVELFYKVHRAEAHRIDGLSRPRTLSRGTRVHQHRTRNAVTTDNDM